MAAIERRVFVGPNAGVINIDDPSEHVFILRHGQARIYVNAPVEEHEASDSVTPNEYHGMLEALSGECYRYEMKAITRCEFGIVVRDDLIASLSRDSELCFRLVEILSRMNRQILNEVSTA